MLKIFFSILFILINMQAFAQTVFINELMSSNNSKLKDEDGDYSDWIELYNAGSASINLSGYGLSDDKKLPLKWAFPEVVLQPQSFLYVFASDKDRKTLPGNLHTNFKISADGEAIYLSNPSGELLDSSLSENIPSDMSLGRKPDGSQNWVIFLQPTAGSSNNNSTEYTASADSVTTSSNGGFFNSPVTLTLTAPSPGAKIYYTLNGSDPTKSSMLYNAPIAINYTTVLRARTFEDTKQPGPVRTITFLINENFQLPVASVTTDPKNLWDPNTGIYTDANYNQNWERPAHLELFETDGKKVLDQDFDVEIFGSYSSRFSQKSLSLTARKSYGKGKFEYKLFPYLEMDEFHSFVLRNGGNDWGYSMIRDAMIQRLIREHTDLDYLEYRPSIVFINGEYWGLHNIREKANEEYIASHHDLDPDDIHLLENNAQVVEGDSTHYMNMMEYITTHSVKNDVDYEYIKTQMDVDNYLDYVITQIYAANSDWPGNNIKFWRTNDASSRWRWILFGTEWSWELYNNSKTQPESNNLENATASSNFGWFNPEWSTYLLRKMLENETFKREFVKRFADHLNVTFNPARVKNIIQELKEGIESDMPRTIDRWVSAVENPYGSIERWNNEIEIMKEFADLRPDNVRSHLRQKFRLDATTKLSYNVIPSGGGNIKTNRLIIPDETFQGVYFRNIPITITAIPKPGYKFAGWSGLSTSTDDTISVILSSDQSLTANFELASTDTNKIVINEINYNSADDHDSEDWIEIFNNSDASIDLSGWMIKGEDSANVYIIPSNTTLAAKKFLVACRDTVKFLGFFPSVKNVIGDLGFGFSAGGEKIRLEDPNGNVIDTVEYDDKLPWPTEPDGNGQTLELKDPALDNSLAENWTASQVIYGTPGAANSIFVDVKEEEEAKVITSYNLEQNYPNPFNPVTRIRYSLPNADHVKLSIYDILGREIITLVNEVKKAGSYEVEFNANNLPSGVYFYSMRTDGYTSTKKMIVAK